MKIRAAGIVLGAFPTSLIDRVVSVMACHQSRREHAISPPQGFFRSSEYAAPAMQAAVRKECDGRSGRVRSGKGIFSTNLARHSVKLIRCSSKSRTVGCIAGSCLCSAWIRFRISFSSSNLCRLRLEWATREFVRPAWSWQELNSKRI
jgi:hypothetical protein